MPQVVYLKRNSSKIPFGFKLQGGSDFSIPLSVLQVTACSIADQAGLKAGDAILQINDKDAYWMDHNTAKAELVKNGNELCLTVERNAVDTVKPAYTPLAQLRVNPQQNLTKNLPLPPIPKTNLTVEKSESILVGSSHNRAPMPFSKEVGTTVIYQSAKPNNWQPGDYTKWTSNNGNTNLTSNQYGSKPDLSSTSSFIHPNPNGMFKSPSVQKLSSSNSVSPRGADSLSMRMLNTNLNEVQGTNRQAASVFDLKHSNPTGATVPRGFRSVQAPVALPPEQRHAPMRKEYQVRHVKQSWIDPK